MKILKIFGTILSVFWTIAFIAYMFGYYEPSRIVVGVLLAFIALVLTVETAGINRRDDAE